MGSYGQNTHISILSEFMEIAAEQLEHLDLGRVTLSLDILDNYVVTVEYMSIHFRHQPIPSQYGNISIT